MWWKVIKIKSSKWLQCGINYLLQWSCCPLFMILRVWNSLTLLGKQLPIISAVSSGGHAIVIFTLKHTQEWRFTNSGQQGKKCQIFAKQNSSFSRVHKDNYSKYPAWNEHFAFFLFCFNSPVIRSQLSVWDLGSMYWSLTPSPGQLK